MNEDAYTPEMVSIGPYLRFIQNLQAMEDQKLQYVRAVLDRARVRTSLEDYVEALKELEVKARECYSDPIKLSSTEFVKMMVFDGLFIIELFRKTSKVVGVDDNDPIFYSSSRRGRVMRDLILLENQIPMSVLQRLFDLSKDPIHHDSLPLIKMALLFFHALIPEAMHKYSQHDSNNITHNHLHLLDLLSYTLDGSLRTPNDKPPISTRLKSLPSVMELRRFGVRFKKRFPYGSLIDIKFDEGVFEIPKLCVDDSTDSFFQNLIAYEQYRFGGRPYITSYALLMDYLINFADDVAFFCDRDIIINQLGDYNKVSSLFSNLCSEVSISDFYYSDLCDKVQDYCKGQLRKCKATLERDYCNNPLKIISVIVAIILLVLTVWSAVFTTVPVFNVHA